MAEFLTAEIRSLDGEPLGVLVLKPKIFKSGSVGYYATGKIERGDVRYQAQAQLVEIGSKDKAAAEDN